MDRDARDIRDVREYGAEGNGESLDTEPLQSALDDCAGTGGTVVVPPGTYLTAPLTVGDDTTLRLRAGATLRFARDHEVFPAKESRWEGWDQTGFHPCLLVEDAENVEIAGRGTVDGQGDYWWQFYGVPDDELPDRLAERLAEFDAANDKGDDVSSFTLRPPLFQVTRSENVTVSGITLCNSPFWNTHVVYSEDVTLHDLSIENPADAPNGDGIDIDSSRFVRVSDTYINAGDDAICLKSGKDEEGRRVGRPTENVVVTNCTVEAGHGGVVIGSETAGDVRHVAVTNCTFTDTDRGIRIKSTRGRGGTVEDLRFDTIVMRGIACPFVINGYYQTDIDSDPVPVDESTPAVRDVHFHHITAKEVESAGFLAGLPERRFGGIRFTDVEIDATRSLDATGLSPAMAKGYDQRHGIYCKSLDDVSFDDVRVRVADGTPLTAEETTDLTLDRFTADADDGSSPAVRAADVDRVRVRGCTPPADGSPFARVSGDGATVSLAGNFGAFADAVVADYGASGESRN